jgi:hypothetical protein
MGGVLTLRNNEADHISVVVDEKSWKPLKKDWQSLMFGVPKQFS